MEKTEFEIRESVLAECQRLCPNKDDQFEFDWGWMKNWGDWFGFYGKCDNPIFVSRPPEYDEYGLFHNFPLAYRLLGLDKRDALEAERGKSAKLVEAFEEIKAMKIYGDDDTDQGFESESDAYHEIKHLAKNALAAYKEGKKDE